MSAVDRNGVSTLGGFLRVLEIDAAGAAQHADAFDRIRSGDLQAVVVNRIYPAEMLEGVVERLERNAPGFLQTWFPEKFRSWFFGRNLNLAEPALHGYFEEAAQFAVQLDALFPSGCELVPTVSRVLSALDHGRPFVAPPGPQPGQRYMFTTLRGHLPGGYIPPHLDNEQALRPSYAHLRSLVELHMTSCILTLGMSEAGGALQVYDYYCDPTDAAPISYDGGTRPDTSKLGVVSLRIPPGAMVILDAGRYLHGVSPVQGMHKRWTACSFMALSRQHDAVYCWG
jgi:hypothetical protein